MDGSALRVVVWVLVVGSLIALVGYTWSRMGSYFDRRLSGSEDEAQADIERYGADAPGIRSEVLGPEDRQAVLDARRRREDSDPVSPTAETAVPVPPAEPGPAGPGPGSTPLWLEAGMLTATTVQVEQQARVLEGASVYALSGPGAVPLGQAVQIGQRAGARLLKATSGLDRNMPVTLEFRDPAGSTVMTLTKPAGVGPQRFAITDPDGAEIRQINQRIRVVREAFELVIAGQPAGVLASDNWYDFTFSVLDTDGAAYAQVQKVYEGYAQARFTSADRYVVTYATNATPHQRAIALAAAIAMDIALFQR